MTSLNAIPVARPVRKVLLYSHDTYGLGHVRRNLAIAQHLLAQRPNLQVVLVTGSVAGNRFKLPTGLSVVPLPPVVKDGPESYRPHDDTLSIGLVRRARTAVIADVARRLRPDVLLVDHAPAGMGGELLDVFEQLADERGRMRIALGLRDVLDEPATVVNSWTRERVYTLLEDVYDEIYVYGQREMFDVGAAYELAPDMCRRLRYTGYLDRSRTAPDAATDICGGKPFLLATAGGGGDGSEVLTAALEASARLGIASLIVTGPFIDPRQRAALDARAAATPGARVVSFHPGVGTLMKKAAAVVTMGGYNSMAEAVAAGTPTVVIPRTWPRREQMIRAELFAARGLVEIVTQGPALVDRLTPALASLLRDSDHRRYRRELDFDGLDRLAEGLLWPDSIRESLPIEAGRAA